MNIRMADVGDIPGILALLRQVGQVHHEIRPDIFRSGALKYDAPALELLLRDAGRPVFVAVAEDTVLGYCFCVCREQGDDGVSTRRRELYIDDLCVEEGSRGSGVAAGLFDRVTCWARESGYDYITLNVWCGNDRAMAFYRKSGLTPRNITMEMKLC